MEKVQELSKNNKYYWFYPKDRINIKFILHNNSLSDGKEFINDKFKNKKETDIILIQLKYTEKTSPLFPQNFHTVLNFFKVSNGKLRKVRNKNPGVVFFKNSLIKDKGFTVKYLKKIVKKFYFDGIETPLLNFKYYNSL